MSWKNVGDGTHDPSECEWGEWLLWSSESRSYDVGDQSFGSRGGMGRGGRGSWKVGEIGVEEDGGEGVEEVGSTTGRA